MTLKLLFQMIFGIFSFDPKNMRWFNVRRILMCLFLLPIFLSLLILNNIFLLLDFVLFPHFYWQKTKEPVFIIAAPRSGTTYLFHLLIQTDHYTYFKLWEIIFAPSICQKYICLVIFRMDRWIGNPLKKLTLYIEKKLIGKLKRIHLIGLNLPEEDEAVLLWSLSSFYLNFFYPDSTFFDDLVLFDDKMKQKQKTRIMGSYNRYVQRHNFVFNRNNDKQYLSKNPLMMSKVASIAALYPDALILNINRSPAETLPSTMALNSVLYGLFTSQSVPNELYEKSLGIVIEWYKMAEKNMKSYFPNQHLKIDFTRLVTQDTIEMQQIANFLGIPSTLVFKKKNEEEKHKSENKYGKLTKEELQTALVHIPFMAEYCK